MKPGTIHSAPAGKPVRRRRIEHLLVYLTAEEQRNFLPGPLFGKLEELATVLTLVRPQGGGPAKLARVLAQTNPTVLFGGWSTPALPRRLPSRLGYFCYLCGSVRSAVTRRHVEDGLLVTNWGDSIARTVAEAALFHVLACLRRSSHWTVAMHTRGAWKGEHAETASLFERRVGLHGFGRVARQFIPLLRPFGVTIAVYAPDVDERTARKWGVDRADTLEALFAHNDIVVDFAPLNAETAAVVKERHLRMLEPGGVFVNVGRGAVVDEKALVRVARDGKLQIGLDVFEDEPLAPEHPLRGMLNVGLTPHLAGPTSDRCCDAGAFAVRNLRRFAAGRRLMAVVTPEVYDAST